MKAQPTDQQTKFIIGLFQKGRSIEYVKAATSSAFADSAYTRLQDIARAVA